jgi:perosamine synthetase
VDTDIAQVVADAKASAERTPKARIATEKERAPLPVWKAIPRFDREYSLADLARAAVAAFDPTETAPEGLDGLTSRALSTHLVRSGREALYLILKLLRLPAGSRVGVPLYCCEAVFEAIAAAGHIPLFLDVELTGYALGEESLWRHRDQIDALILVHMFGYPANLGRIRSCLEGRDIPIIEDCAHALFTDCEGMPAGTCADASFFTFGLHKPAAVGGGALLLVNSPRISAKGVEEAQSLANENTLSELRHALACWLRSLFYYRLTCGLLLASPWAELRDRGRNGGESGVRRDTKQWIPSRTRRGDRILVGERVMQFQKRAETLVKTTEKIRQGVCGTSLSVPGEPAYGKWNHFLLPVRYQDAQHREAARRYLFSRRIDTSPLYQNCARNARRFGYQGGCPLAEHAAATVFTLPNQSWLSATEVEYIVESLRSTARMGPA